ncbi:amino acid adenylation domain-containing protein [Streptomyces sp. NPDC003280]|uniref:amino acid adenylation domain-containing protein n=1 Tax=Streptomyces sp. NPDC003280 TaxID=3364680 RepID=UPI0036C74E02
MTGGKVETFALLGAQQGILYAQQLVPDSPIFNIGQAVWFGRRLDPALLDEAVRRAVAEADILGGSLLAQDDGARIAFPAEPAAGPTTAVHDLAQRPEPRAAALHAMRADLAVPRDLTGNDLVHSAFYLLGENESVWYFRSHHVLLDAYGLMLVSRRAGELYTALAEGREPRPRWFGRFADLLEEEIRAEAEPARETERAFWARKVDGRSAQRVPGVLGSSGLDDYAKPPHRVTAELGEAAERRLREAADAHGVTWGDIVIAGWGTYLSKVMAGDHVAPGLPMMCRTTPTALSTPAVSVNILPLHIDVDPGATVAETVRHFAGEVDLVRSHQRYRRENIAREAGLIGTDGRLSGSQINIKAFDYHLDFGGATGVQQGLSTGPVDDLSLSAYLDSTHGLRFDLDANASLFDPPSVKRHLHRFVAYFEKFLAAGEERVGALAVADEADLRQVVADWNLGPRPDDDETLLSLLDARFTRAGADPAVVFRGESRTFAELDASANRLCRHLLATGIGAGDRVAVALPRSHDLVVALVAVLRCGAAYVPVDTAYPDDRIEYMLRDTRAPVVITSDEFRKKLEPILEGMTGTVLLTVDEPATSTAIAARPAGAVTDADRGGRLHPRSPAYVIYTSGTTGRPKGVVLSHRSIVNRIRWGQSQLFALSHRDRVLQKAPISFDVSVTEIFWTLASGAVVVLAEPGRHGDPAHLTRLMRDESVTLANFVPSMLQAFLESEPDPADLALRHVVCSGEALPRRLALELADRLGVTVWNTYGPTETGELTFHRVDPRSDSAVHGGIEPLGRPAAVCDCYILDRFLRPVPPGVPGELYLAGAQLANGYHDQPSLTAARFVANPCGEPGERLYRTGDLAMWSDYGTIVYLGRNDDQIKIRGFRVELAEIAAVAARTPGVAHCVVVPKTAPSGALVLVAYVVPDTGADLAGLAERVVHTTGENLPDHMVPSFVLTLDRVPMTPNGKLDRRALPDPDYEAVETGRPPAGDLETRVARIFEDVLGLSRVGADDDFFQLGGHSLLAARIVLRTNREFGTDISLRTLFDHPTVASLAGRLDDSGTPS